jgi:hypothetical protein
VARWGRCGSCSLRRIDALSPERPGWNSVSGASQSDSEDRRVRHPRSRPHRWETKEVAAGVRLKESIMWSPKQLVDREPVTRERGLSRDHGHLRSSKPLVQIDALWSVPSSPARVGVGLESAHSAPGGGRSRCDRGRPAWRRRNRWATAVHRVGGGRYRFTTKVVVVAGSLGGFTAPLVCEQMPGRERVLINAMIPVPGEAARDWWAHTGAVEAQKEAAAPVTRTVC